MSEKIVYRGNDTLFYNSQCIFVEYHDIIAMPWLTMLAAIKNSTAFNNILNISEISSYDIRGLLEWYIYRKHRNVFKSIGPAESIGELPEDAYDILLEKAMSISEDIYRIPTNLKFLSTLRLLVSDSSMIKQVIVYSEKNEPMIEDTLKRYFEKSGKVKYFYGKFEDLVKIVPNDSTYVFSDITKVDILRAKDKLNLSCVLIASGLRYNYMEDDASKLKIDLEELMKTHVFKYSFFDNFDLTNMLSDNLLSTEECHTLDEIVDDND